jgi:hypothetical protein
MARSRWTCVNYHGKVTHMTKTQVYLRREELDALHKAARRSGRSIAELVREAVRKTWLRHDSEGPVGLWDGNPRRASKDHDSIYDRP